MQPDSERALYHVQIAIALISQFIDGAAFDEYNLNLMMRSAVERQLIAIGEAVNVLYKVDPALASRVTDYRRIINLRNRLAHGFFNVNPEIIWRIANDDLPVLRQEVAALLAELEDR